MSKSTVLVNSTGISFDFTNLYGEGKIALTDIEELQEQINRAALAIKTMREKGEIKGHLSKDGIPEKVLFSQLPYIKENNINSPESIGKLHDFAAKCRDNVDAVISLGIGGSFLGNKVLFDIGCGEFWNNGDAQKRKGWPALYFSGNNVDGTRTSALLREVIEQAKICEMKTGKQYKVLLLVISKSGSTLETMACFMYLLAELRKSSFIDVEVVAVTDSAVGERETLLHRLARENSWTLFRVPDGVGGRFSVFSDVGLVTATATGLDMEEFLAGARDMDEACQSSNPFENMALMSAILKYISAQKYGRSIEVFMPYADSLKSLAEWYIQLLAESLGKTLNKEGETVYYGRTPIVAVGTTDMHAQTQQHQEGALDKLVSFVKVNDWQKDILITDYFPNEQVLADMAGFPFSKAMNAALEANAEALSANGRFNTTITLPRINLYYVGAFMYMLALAVAYEGELANVDAFDQPGVEAYKKILKVKLAALKKNDG